MKQPIKQKQKSLKKKSTLKIKPTESVFVICKNALNSCGDNYGSEAADNGRFEKYHDSKLVNKALEILNNMGDWKPFCFGSYQGVGDDSCFVCPFNNACDTLAQERNKKTTCFYCGDNINGPGHKKLCLGWKKDIKRLKDVKNKN